MDAAARELIKIARALVAKKKFKVYRVGRGKTLDNRNAGDMGGLAKFLEDTDDIESVQRVGGDALITEYEVEVDGFGPYQYFRGGKAPGEPSDLVGVKNQHGDLWYSFPKGGKWKVKKVGKSVPAKKVLLNDKGYIHEVWWKGGRAGQFRHLKKFF